MQAGKSLPTPYVDVNQMLDELMSRVQAILGDRFVGMYLDGSLTTGAFDSDSDIDFVVVTGEEVSGDLFASLQAMHDRIATLNSPWAIQLEGSYISRRALRRYDPAHSVHPNIERGQGERLKMVFHDAAWLVHLSIVREHGITLAGPAPKTLIDPVSPADLRRAMVSMLPGWAGSILDTPARIQSRGYQSYIVLSLCRVLYTLQHGTVTSKPAAARWAQETLGGAWAPLIERAWVGRHGPDGAAAADDVNETLAFIRYTMARSLEFAE